MKLHSAMIVLGCFFFTIGCSDSPSSSTPVTQSATTDQSNNDSQNSDTSNDNNDSSNPSEEGTPSDEVALITETQARATMEASCMAASCHADVDVIFNSPDVLTRLENNTMPPPDQQRYTLSTRKRAELVLFFQSQ